MTSSPQNSVYYQYERMAYPNQVVNNNESVAYYNEITMDDGKWTREQTQVLIDTWKEHKSTLLNTASSSAEHFRVWKIISNEVNKFSPPKSLQQCKKKFRNIRYICKTAMNNNKQHGSKKHYPMFYPDFVDIISESERIRGSMRGSDVPSVEIIRDTSLDEESMEYPNVEDHSPPNGENNSDISNEMSLKVEEGSTQKSLLSTNKIPSFNSTDGSYHDSPLSRDGEDVVSNNESSASPSVSINNDKSEVDEINDDSKRNSNARSEEYCADEKRAYMGNSDTIVRKHKNTDVSIMGRGYPPLKRLKKAADNIPPTSLRSSPIMDFKTMSTAALHNDRFPTMAPLSQNPDYLTVSNSYLSPEVASVFKRQRTIMEPSVTTSSSLKENVSSNSKLPTKSSEQSKTYSIPQIVYPEKNNESNSHQREFNERFLDIQERQMEVFSDMLNRHEQFLLRLLAQQREAAEEAQKRDREFMLKLIEMMFVKNSS